MCIEDNPFPKRCSFYDGMQEELERSSTFCGKIQAAVEKRHDSDFVVLARTEALIKGLGIDRPSSARRSTPPPVRRRS